VHISDSSAFDMLHASPMVRFAYDDDDIPQ